MAKIVIVDDHELLAESLRIALSADGIDAARVEPSEHRQLLTTVCAHRPDLVLLDLDLGAAGDATPLIAPLSATGARVLLVTGIVDRTRIAAALEQGAVGYRSKADGFDTLLETVRAACAGQDPLGPLTRSVLLDELHRARRERARALAPFCRLTPREQDTLRAIAEGLSAQDIANDWRVSETTVRTHVQGVLRKLGVRSQLAAVAAARRGAWFEHRSESDGTDLAAT